MFISKNQSGFALAVSLILLVVMSLIGLMAARRLFMEEKMTSSYKDYLQAFQLAEDGLLAAKRRIEREGLQAPPSGCFHHPDLRGLCANDVEIDPSEPSQCRDTNIITFTNTDPCWKEIGNGAEYIIQYRGYINNKNTANRGCSQGVKIYTIYSRYQPQSQERSHSNVYLKINYFDCLGNE